MQKKIVFLLLLLGSVLLFTVGVSAAETVITIDAPETLPEAGEEFTVKVSIAGNPGLCSIQYSLDFDRNIVNCEEITLGNLLSKMFKATNPNASTGAKIAAAATDAMNEDGILAEYRFKVMKTGNPAFVLCDSVFSDEEGTQVFPQFGTYSWKQEGENTPEQSNMTIPAENDVLPPVSSGHSFPDVPESYWGYEVIEKAANLGLITGNPDGSFEPQKEMTRAQFVTVLYRLAGAPSATDRVEFPDVPANAWYADAVYWAASQGYATGDGVNFNPNGKITRQEVVTILFRYNGGASAIDALISAFSNKLEGYEDQGDVASWAKEAMNWALNNGIITGRTDTMLYPKGTALRSEVAAFFVRYVEK